MIICVSLNEKTFADYKKTAQKYDFVELRLDLFNFSDEELNKLLELKTKFIVSFLDTKTLETKKTEKLKQAIKLGADIIDIDINISEKNIKNLVSYTKQNNCKTIISYHNFNKTPETETLENIINKINKFSPDYIKIVCQANSIYDFSKIKPLYKNYKNLIAFNMGEKGKNSRIDAIKLGSPIIYVSSQKGKETAAGQLSFDEFKNQL